MLIRLIPPAPHPTILYVLTFPSVLPLHDISPNMTVPAAWSSQLQILTSILQLEPPSSIHMLDRAVGLVARVHEVSMNVPQKEFVVKFVDGRVTNVPMNSDCVRMLLDVVLDVKGCSESESQRSSMEGSASPASTRGSIDHLPSGSSPTKSSKPGKHKKQRSLLFSLISSLVPKSLSLSSSPPPSTAPPPAPFPPLPVTSRATTPLMTQRPSLALANCPDFLRKRARATLVDVWRRHVVSTITPQHLPAAGYLEWTLIAMATKVRAEMESAENAASHGFGVTRAGGSRHRKTRSQGRNALDLGERSDDSESELSRCRAPSPFPRMLNEEDADQVVYPRRESTDEWGVRRVNPSFDEADVFAVEYTGHNDTRLGEHFTVGDDWDESERLTLELSHMGCQSTLDVRSHSPNFGLDYTSDGDCRLVDMTFDTSSCPLIPSDVNDDEESDDSQTSLRTPEDGEDLPLVLPAHGSSHHYSASEPPLVSRASSSRPRSRNASAQFSSPPSPVQSCPPSPSTCLVSSAHDFDCRDTEADDFMASRFDYLERICAALEIVRTRAREEGWRLFRATLIGAKNGWMDAEAERSLEARARRRAWSSGIKISAPYPYPASCLAPNVWDGSLSTVGSPVKPPGLISPLTGILRMHGPIVPTGLSLGIPVQSSPLALYSWGADNRRSSVPSHSVHTTETIEGKRPPRVSFAGSVSKLFPVCEDENEDMFEPVQANVVGFPQSVPVSVSAGGPDRDLMEGMENGDDPFYFCPSRPRTRTTSMYVIPPTTIASPSPALPIFRPSTPPPSYQFAVGEDDSAMTNDNGGTLDSSSLLLQPLSPSPISSLLRSPSDRPPLALNPPFVPRPRAISLPTPTSHCGTNKTRRTSFNHRDEHVEDLSQAYASPPPEGPLVITTTLVPQEQYPRYAHIHSPIPTKKKSHAAILGRTGKEVVFEQAGSEFTVGIDVALGRAEEGRVVW